MGSPHPVSPPDFRFDGQRGTEHLSQAVGEGLPVKIPRAYQGVRSTSLRSPAPHLAVSSTARKPESKRRVPEN